VEGRDGVNGRRRDLGWYCGCVGVLKANCSWNWNWSRVVVFIGDKRHHDRGLLLLLLVVDRLQGGTGTCCL
jgi:hypothetical protein